MSWLAGLMQGGSNAMSSIINFNANRELQGNANTASAEQAALNRDWQEKMSNTAHQREVEDLRKAGLNPILSAGGGASTPSGAVATMHASTADFKSPQFLQSLLTAEMAKTEKSKQELNSAQKVATEKQADLTTENARMAQVSADFYDSWLGKNIVYPAERLIGLVNSASSAYDKLSRPTIRATSEEIKKRSY